MVININKPKWLAVSSIHNLSILTLTRAHVITLNFLVENILLCLLINHFILSFDCHQVALCQEFVTFQKWFGLDLANISSVDGQIFRLFFMLGRATHINYYNRSDVWEKLDEEGSIWVIHSQLLSRKAGHLHWRGGEAGLRLGIPGIASIGPQSPVAESCTGHGQTNRGQVVLHYFTQTLDIGQLWWISSGKLSGLSLAQRYKQSLLIGWKSQLSPPSRLDSGQRQSWSGPSGPGLLSLTN